MAANAERMPGNACTVGRYFARYRSPCALSTALGACLSRLGTRALSISSPSIPERDCCCSGENERSKMLYASTHLLIMYAITTYCMHSHSQMYDTLILAYHFTSLCNENH